MNLCAMLKTLAEGVNPETGKVLPENSEANEPGAGIMLLKLVDELSVLTIIEQTEKLFGKQKMEQNLALGKPARSYYPWIEEEKKGLAASYLDDISIEELASKHQRTQKAIAIQLHKMEVITEEELGVRLLIVPVEG